MIPDGVIGLAFGYVLGAISSVLCMALVIGCRGGEDEDDD